MRLKAEFYPETEHTLSIIGLQLIDADGKIIREDIVDVYWDDEDTPPYILITLSALAQSTDPEDYESLELWKTSLIDAAETIKNDLLLIRAIERELGNDLKMEPDFYVDDCDIQTHIRIRIPIESDLGKRILELYKG